jgi:energy-coupling factor transporter transmembrane protein EcfT
MKFYNYIFQIFFRNSRDPEYPNFPENISWALTSFFCMINIFTGFLFLKSIFEPDKKISSSFIWVIPLLLVIPIYFYFTFLSKKKYEKIPINVDKKTKRTEGIVLLLYITISIIFLITAAVLAGYFYRLQGK